MLFAALLLAGIYFDTIYGLPFYTYLILAILYSLVLFYGCYVISSNFFLPVTCSAETTRKEIAISFDDGPVAATPEIAKLLREHKIEATFFCIGNRIAGMEQILQTLHTDGHIIGNHSYSHHFWFDLFSSAKMLNELKTADDAVTKATGLRPKLFRPPYGVMNPNLKKAIVSGNYIPVGWSVRSMDTVINDREKLLSKTVKAVRPGAIFLFHDTSKTTLEILPEFIRDVTAKGYQIIRLDKMLNLKAYA